MLCQKCGCESTDTTRFCVKCGTKMVAAEPQTTTPASRPRAARSIDRTHPLWLRWWFTGLLAFTSLSMLAMLGGYGLSALPAYAASVDDGLYGLSRLAPDAPPLGADTGSLMSAKMQQARNGIRLVHEAALIIAVLSITAYSLLTIAIVVAIGGDAGMLRSRSPHPDAPGIGGLPWVICGVLLPMLVVPVYLFVRQRHCTRHGAP